MRIEQCDIIEGEEVFDLQGSSENILYYNQKPFAYEWGDNSGSIAKYLARSNSPIEINESLQHIRYYAENGIHDDVKLVYAIDPLLRLLSNGKYELIYPFSSSDFGLDLLEFENQELINFYPTALTLICLQPIKNLDIARVKYFKEKINKGIKPVIFVLGSYKAGDKYILDGHHKAYAYKSLGVEPTILFIKKISDSIELSNSMKKEALNHIFPNGEIAKNKVLLTKFKKH